MSAHPAPEPTPSRLVDAFEAGRRARSIAEANEIRLLADAAAAVARPADATPAQARRAELDRRALIADLATSTRTSEWTVTRLLTEATDLCTRFARGVNALARGEISRAHLAVIHDIGDPISDEQARDEFLTIALDRAAHLTPGRLAPALRVIAERFQDRTIDERHTDAVARRSVEVTDLPDGLAALTLTHDATLVHGIHDRLTAQARSVIAARETGDTPDSSAERPGEDAAQGASLEGGAVDGAEGAEAAEGGAGTEGGSGTESAEGVDTRTMDQLRADVAADVLLSAGPDDCVAGTGLDAIRATVQVTVPVLTMTGASDEPTLLADRPESVVRFVADSEILARRRVMREPWAFAAASPPDSGAPF